MFLCLLVLINSKNLLVVNSNPTNSWNYYLYGRRATVRARGRRYPNHALQLRHARGGARSCRCKPVASPPTPTTCLQQAGAGDNLFTLTDPAGNRNLYTYNARGELTAIQDPLAGLQRFRYSATGTLLEYQDQSGNTTTGRRYTYDAVGRLILGTESLVSPILFVADVVIDRVMR